MHNDWQEVFSGQVRALEDHHKAVHARLLNWAKWGRGKHIGEPTLKPPSVWSLPGEHDPDLDPDAVPESPLDPVDEKDAIAIDVLISSPDFPAIWRNVLKVNYIRRPSLEYQMPGMARLHADAFLQQLSNVLNYFHKVCENSQN